ncbi:MAG: hypothetical protein M3403_03555 [Gemmatimonadota bacterium]|nr:hypothetical protein [Gemmatimonadota bacterium]
MASNLAAFGLPERLRCSSGVRAACEGTQSVEEAGQSLCEFFYDELIDPEGKRACALVRFYVTQPFARLPRELKEFARSAAGGLPIGEESRCLTLLATVGDEREWNSRFESRGHQAIPLLNAAMVEKAPMIAELLKAFGLNTKDVVGNLGPIVPDLGGKSYGVFYVPDAKGSEYIPAQTDFVVPHGIKSVVGCGSALSSGELFAMIIFAKIPVTAESAERFRPLALDAKASLLRFSADDIFE